MKLLQGMRSLCYKIPCNKTCSSSLVQRSFHMRSCLLEQAKFDEKPLWLKKFKLKQAAMQKDDGLPTFLKKGLPDKILYNLTLVGVIFGVIWSFKVVADFDKIGKK